MTGSRIAHYLATIAEQEVTGKPISISQVPPLFV